MDTAKVADTYTTDYIESLPEGERAELIDGQLYMMAPPSGTHQDISMFLSTEINNYIRSKKGNCKVYAAPYGVYLNKDDKTYVEPDITVICDKDKATEKGCVGAPDWVIEIVSTGSMKMDYMIKPTKYKMAGVREYWLVDPKTKGVLVYNFEKDEMESFTFSEKIKAGIYDDLEIDFSELDLQNP